MIRQKAISLRLDNDLLAALDIVARECLINRNRAINQAVSEWIHRQDYRHATIEAEACSDECWYHKQGRCRFHPSDKPKCQRWRDAYARQYADELD